MPPPLNEAEIKVFEALDLVYRTLGGILYNFVPTSGHPGGSMSGRIVETLLYHTLCYDFSWPDLMEKKGRSEAAAFFAKEEGEKWRAPEVPKTMLVCENCSAQVDPLAYFADQPLPADEICLTCERRSREACAYCLAFWMNENPAIKFLCAKCANADLMDAHKQNANLLD